MKNTILHEPPNFLISSVAMILTMYTFGISLSSGFAYQLARLIDKIRILIGLIPQHMIPKMATGYSPSIVPANIILFIIFNLIFGFAAYKLVKKRGTKYSGLVHGLFISIVFLIISSILTHLSNDPFNWLAVMFGFPITLFVQTSLALCILFQK